jgi:homoserine O-acetyltransferase
MSHPGTDTPQQSLRPIDGTHAKGLAGKQFFTSEAPFRFECGKILPAITLAYETFGRPNAERSNAILLCHALTGDSHVARHHAEDAPGWWEALVGPGKAFDTNHYWIVCANVLGGCQGSTGPSSLDPDTGRPYGTDFPVVTIGDMVEAQARLADFLGISRWVCVAGGSMGGFQALEWSLRFPERVQATIGIATSPRLSAQAIAFNAVGRHAITSDPAWQGGHYYPGHAEVTCQAQFGPEIGPATGLATARMMAHITYLSEESLDRKFGRQLQQEEGYRYELTQEFAVESYLHHQGEKFIRRFDANTYLYLSKALDYFDVSASHGEGVLENAFKKVQSSYLLLSYSSDWLFPTQESQRIARALLCQGKDVSFTELTSPYGHDAFLLEAEPMTRIIRPFLQRVTEERKGRLWSDYRTHLAAANFG